LFEWNGSKKNNIVWMGAGAHNFTAFRDNNPATADASRYKAFGRGRGVVQLRFVLKKADIFSLRFASTR